MFGQGSVGLILGRHQKVSRTLPLPFERIRTACDPYKKYKFVRKSCVIQGYRPTSVERLDRSLSDSGSLENYCARAFGVETTKESIKRVSHLGFISQT